MKIFSVIFSILASIFIIINITKLDFSDFTSNDSMAAIAGIVCSLIIIVLLLIVHQSKKIEKLKKRNN